MAELSQVKAAKSELDSRVAALEAQLQAAAVARAASEAKEADLVQALEVRGSCRSAPDARAQHWFQFAATGSHRLSCLLRVIPSTIEIFGKDSVACPSYNVLPWQL